MNTMITRSRAKKVEDIRENQEKDCYIDNYCKTIDNLKKRLTEQELLNKTLMEEQEMNAKEFEVLC